MRFTVECKRLVKMIESARPKLPGAKDKDMRKPFLLLLIILLLCIDTVRAQAPGQPLVLVEQPKDVPAPKTNLSRAERLENFDILAEAIDKNFSFFNHKNIKWPEITAQYRMKVGAAATDDDFYLLLHEFVRELKDFHSWLCNYKRVPELGQFSPAMHTRMIEGRCVVTEVEEGSEARAAGVSRGCVVLGVDGLTIEKRLEAIRPLIHLCSSERGFLEQAYRRVLDGERGTHVRVTFINAAGLRATANLQRVDSRRGSSRFIMGRDRAFRRRKGCESGNS